MNFQNVTFELSAGKKGQFPESQLPEIVFSGKSNVGKSSLINRLVNRKSLARVSATPGKTVTINFYRFPQCRFVDLPGYGYAKVSRAEKERWGDLVEGYFQESRKIALVFQLLDFRHPLSENDEEMIDFLLQTELPFAVICTKSDKLNQSQRLAQEAYYSDLFHDAQIPFYPFSAVNGTGIEAVKLLIEQAVSESL